MSVDEQSIGPLYLAVVKTKLLCPPHLVGITEQAPPWRRGRAFALPFFPTWALVLGLWRRHHVENPVYEDEPWLEP